MIILISVSYLGFSIALSHYLVILVVLEKLNEKLPRRKTATLFFPLRNAGQAVVVIVTFGFKNNSSIVLTSDLVKVCYWL